MHKENAKQKTYICTFNKLKVSENLYSVWKFVTMRYMFEIYDPYLVNNAKYLSEANQFLSATKWHNHDKNMCVFP